MFGNAVAHMALETVTGIAGAERAHQPIAYHLGDNRGCRDRRCQCIARYYCGAIATAVDAVSAVNEHKLRPGNEAVNSLCERPQRSPEYIVAIDACG